MAAVVYAAKSSPDPRASIPAQLADCRAAAEAEGREVVAEYSDENASAFSGNRGRDLLAAKDRVVRLAAERGAGRAEIWFQHSDRPARGDGITADHLAEVWFALRRGGVRMRSVQDDHNLEDAIRVVLIGERNHEDSKRKSAATRAGKRRRFQSGKPVGGPVPFGYRLIAASDGGRPVVGRDGRIERRWEPDRRTAPLVRRMFDLVLRGMTVGQVARLLNAEGQRTSRDKPWEPRSVRYVVTNATYAGFVVLRDGKGCEVERRPGQHEPLVERETFEAVHAALGRRDPAATQVRRGGRPPRDESYVLRQVAFCGACGEPLYPARQRHGRRDVRGYECGDRRRHRGTCRDSRWIRAELAERAVLFHLDKFLGDVGGWLADRARERLAEREDLAAAVKRERARLAELDGLHDIASARWRRLLTAGNERGAEVVEEQLRAVDDDREAQRRRIEDAEARAAEWRAEPAADEALAAYEELRALVTGSLGGARGAQELNAALRSVLEGVWLTLSPAGGLRAAFALLPSERVATWPLVHGDWERRERLFEQEGDRVVPRFSYSLPRGFPLPVPAWLDAAAPEAESRRDTLV